MASAVHSIDAVLENPDMGAFRWRIYIICGLLMGLEGYDAYIVANLAPIIAQSIHVTIPAMAYVFVAQSAGMALGFYTIPILADRIGRRGIILAGATIFGILTLVSTMVGTLSEFAFIRFLTFMALGGTMPNIVALVSELIPDSRRGQLIAWLFIGHGLGASAAGLIGPTFVALHSWQAAFWVGGVLLLAFIPMLYVALPESCRYLIVRNPSDPRIGQTLRLIDPAFQWSQGATFSTVETKVGGSPVAGLFRDGRAPLTLLLWLSMGAALCVTATLTAWMPSFLHVLGGLETATAARMLGISALGAIIGPVMLTFLMKRIGTPIALCLTLVIAFFAMNALSLVAQVPALGWVLGFSYGLFVIGAQAGLNSLVASSYPTSIRSTGIGWAGGVGRLTSMIGPGVGGAILAAKWSAPAIYLLVASPLLLAAAAMLILYLISPRRSRRDARRTGYQGSLPASP